MRAALLALTTTFALAAGSAAAQHESRLKALDSTVGLDLPGVGLDAGLRKTYMWIKEQIENEKKEGKDNNYAQSEIVQQVDDSLMQLGKDKSTAITETK